MKKYILGFLLVLFCQIVNGQTYTQTFKDKCTGEIKIATTTMTNGYATVSFYNQIRVFSPTEVMAGAVQLWITTTYTAYNTMGCPTAQVVQQTVQNTVTQAASAAAAAAASSAASAAASSAASSSASAAASSSASAAASSSASSAASSSASGAASSSASGAATSSASSTPPPTSSSSGSSTSGGSGSSSGSSSSSSSSSSSESKTETKSESSSSSSESKSESKSETKSESKSEEKKSESKSEEKKDEKKSEEKKEEKKEDKKEEKKDEKKKEEKKKAVNANPMMLASDLAGTEDAEGKYAVMMSFGVSRSSMMGDKSYSATALIWSTLNQFALSGGVTKMDFADGKLNAIHSYGTTFAYLKGTLMNLNGYTWIKPHPKYGTYGYNVGLITLLMQNPTKGGYDVSLSSSFVGFWMKPYTYSRKVTLTPQVFVMQSPLAWNTVTGGTTVNRTPGAMVGIGYDYKISKRFGFSTSYKASMMFTPEFSIMNNFQIGSKMVF